MEPITHFLTGACIGRAGLNRKTAYATLAAVLAAEAADADILWSLAGPVKELQHHRGITHTFLGAPVVAGVVVGMVWLGHTWLERRRVRKQVDVRGLPPIRQKLREAGSSTQVAAATSAQNDRTGYGASERRPPVRWGWLYGAALIAALSHILLDWTNNYGVRPFFPFNPRWYEGSIVFIAEPVLWGLFLIALLLPWLLGLADSEIGARKKPFRARGWAIFALSGMVALWCWRWGEQAQARAMLENMHVAAAPVTRMALEPYPVNPYRWHVILETADYYQTAEVNTWTGEVDSDVQQNITFKPADTPAVEAAKQTLLGKVYLDWGRWAVLRDVGQEPMDGIDPPELPLNRKWTTVEFSDLRFAYSILASQRGGRSPLSGWVYLVDGRDEAGEGMGNHQQK